MIILKNQKIHPTLIFGCKKGCKSRNYLIYTLSCGETGIRTLGTVTRSPHFECGPIDHSGISPKAFLLSGRKYTIYSIILIWKIHFLISACPPPPCRHAYPLQNALQSRLACSHPPCKHTCRGKRGIIRAHAQKKATFLRNAAVHRCGEGGIRTPGAFQLNSFQDCRNRPLYHLSRNGLQR